METGRDARSVKSLSRHALEQIVTLCSEGILLADAQDPNLPIVYANPAYEDLSGYSAEELKGSSWRLAKRDGEGQPELERLKAAVGRAESCQAIVSDLRKDGTSWFSHVSIEPLYNGRGELKYFLCIQRPVGDGTETPVEDTAGVEVGMLQRELGRARQKIASLNRSDPATGLLRLEYFYELLDRDLAVARRDGRFVAILLFEIVEFDAYRTTFGTKAADSCQRMIGAQITRALRRAGDLCARFDDSMLVASALGQREADVRHVAEQIGENVRRLGLHNPRAKSGRHVTINYAVVECAPGTVDDAETLVRQARDELDVAVADRAASS
jgi:diguanylate cyclase (GGDEF)-like protein/PAS domain S-box-containing protein